MSLQSACRVFVNSRRYGDCKLTKEADTDLINTVLSELHEQLGLTASFFDIQMKEKGATVSIKWQDEGGKRSRLSRVVSPKDMENKPMMMLLTPLCDDTRSILLPI